MAIGGQALARRARGNGAALAPVPVVRAFGWPGKRAFDVVLSLALLLLTLPLLLVLALAVKLTSRGPVLFRQQRVGAGGRTFSILKFRTMHADAEERLEAEPELLELYLVGGHKIVGHDPRVTRIGRLLRRASLDELPQLLNVLAGQMSLVGPRPVRPSELIHYEGLESAYFSVRPGLTGLWQVSGRNEIQFPERAQLDHSYWERCSLGFDLLILSRTLIAVVSARGAY